MVGISRVDRMTKPAKNRPKKPAKVETEFDEGVTDKKKLEGEIARAKREAGEVGKYVDERRDSIRRGARRSRHRFRL